MRYDIVKYEYPNFFEPTALVKLNVSLEEAQAHCQRDDTKVDGEWFHGYTESKHPNVRHKPRLKDLPLKAFILAVDGEEGKERLADEHN